MLINQSIIDEVKNRRNELERCPCCNSNIKDRKITIYEGLVRSLFEICKWCSQNKKHEFSTKEIRHLLGKIEYTRFGDLVRFGGIVYKPKDEKGKTQKAFYGINLERAREFFMGKRQIPVQITVNQITGEIIDTKNVYVYQIPKLASLLKENGLYDYESSVRI